MESIIEFYGVDEPELFAIERRAMDRSGRVTAALERILPSDGLTLDLGAGDGFTAQRLSESRLMVGLEPSMTPAHGLLRWVRGAAPDLPFASGAFSGAFSTWAYFFSDFHPLGPGLADLNRVVRPGGPMIVVDNAGDDAFTAMADPERPIVADLAFWATQGFDIEIVETSFEFDSMSDARTLLTRFFGKRARPSLEVGFRAAVMTKAAARRGR